jgi:Ca2+-binding RTX toxin-like protein
MAFYADTVLEYFDSKVGPLPGPYGFFDPNGNGFFDPGEPPVPSPISLNAVLGPDLAPGADALSLPTGSYVTVGFRNELIYNGPGNDLFIRELGEAGDRANVYVSANGKDFTYLGTAQDDVTTAFDLSTINYTQSVKAVRIVGLDKNGASPGFDVANVQALQAIIGNRRLYFTGTIEIDIMIGLQFQDYFDGGDGDDTLCGRSGNDRIIGNIGNDKIWGNDDDDDLEGNEGDDRINGGSGKDKLTGGAGDDSLVGGKDNDSLRGDGGKDKCFGGKGRDRIRGGKGDDDLNGGDDDDDLKGGSGDDVLRGGKGDDKLDGGSGNDIYFCERGSGTDIIRGFKKGSDRFKLGKGLGLSELQISSESSTTTISFGEETIMTIVNVKASLITTSDFITG